MLNTIIIKPIKPLSGNRAVIMLLCSLMGVSFAYYWGFRIKVGELLNGLFWLSNSAYLGRLFNREVLIHRNNRVEKENYQDHSKPHFIKKLERLWFFCVVLFSLVVLKNLVNNFFDKQFASAFFLLVFFIAFFRTGTSGLFNSVFLLATYDGIFFGSIIPGFSYYMQSAKVHNLLSVYCLPLAFFLAGYFFVNELPKTPHREGDNPIIYLLGPKKYLNVYSLFILTASLLLIIFSITLLPKFLLIPVLISSPLFIKVHFLLAEISYGEKINYKKINILNNISIILLFSISFFFLLSSNFY